MISYKLILAVAGIVNNLVIDIEDVDDIIDNSKLKLEKKIMLISYKRL